MINATVPPQCDSAMSSNVPRSTNYRMFLTGGRCNHEFEIFMQGGKHVMIKIVKPMSRDGQKIEREIR